MQVVVQANRKAHELNYGALVLWCQLTPAAVLRATDCAVRNAARTLRSSRRAGADEIYCLGGVQSVAAMALGTETSPAVLLTTSEALGRETMKEMLTVADDIASEQVQVVIGTNHTLPTRRRRALTCRPGTGSCSPG